MQFLNPLYLLGLVAATIPIIIHLLIIRKNKLVEFSSIRFLKELQKTQIRRLKVKQILLLVLRTLIIVFLVLSFARPVVKSNFPFFRNYSNVSTVIILDNSVSMDVSDEYGNRFRQAKNFARKIISNLVEGDEVTVVYTSNNTDSTSFQSTFESVQDDISRANISVLTSSFESAIRKTQKTFGQAKNYYKEIFIISDFQKSSLLPFSDSSKFFDENTIVNLVQVGAKSKISINNLSIDTVVPLSTIYEIGKNLDFEVRIKNNSQSSFQNVVLSLIVNGEKVAQRIFNINSKSFQNVIIGFSPKDYGAYRCLFELETDALDYDNKYWYGLVVPKPPTVALITDDVTGHLATFLKSLDGSRIQLKIVPLNFIRQVDLGGNIVVIIENPQILTLDEFQDYEFLLKADGFLLFPVKDGSAQAISNIMNIFGIKANFEYKTFSPNNQPYFTFIDKDHPLLRGVFKPSSKEENATIDAPRIKAMLPTSSGIQIIQTNAGSFLTEFNRQGLKLLYCSVSPSIAWGNLPFSSIFPVLIYSSIYYLTFSYQINYVVPCGTNLSISLPTFFISAGINIEDPLLNKYLKIPTELPSGPYFDLDNLNLLGVYVLSDQLENVIGTVSANIDSRESDLELSEENTILSYFSAVFKKGVTVNYFDNPKSFVEKDFRKYSGAELWKFFLILSLICAIGEMIIAKTSKKEISK